MKVAVCVHPNFIAPQKTDRRGSQTLRVFHRIGELERACLRSGGNMIRHEGDPTVIPEGMPAPGSAEIVVCGAYMDICVAEMTEALRAVGYDASIDRGASLRGNMAIYRTTRGIWYANGKPVNVYEP